MGKRITKAQAIEFQVWDHVTLRYVTVRRRGRIFMVGGVAVKLFEFRVMCQAIDRTQRTLMNWERAGMFPRPMFAIPGSRTKRWYSEAQIKMANEVWKRYRHLGKSKHFPLDSFLAAIREQFYKVDVELIKSTEANDGTRG